MKQRYLPLILGLGLLAPGGAVLADEAEEEITIQVLEGEDSSAITQQIKLPEPLQAQNRERHRERLRVNQEENEEALREERQEMHEYRMQSQEQAQETRELMQQEAQDLMQDQAEQTQQQQGDYQLGR